MTEDRVIGPLHQDKNLPNRQKGKDIDSIKRSEVAECHLVRAGDADGVHLTCELWQSLRELVAVYQD